ncbi:MAG: diadenylate cyclase CdaA [Christensenellales bacterium]|jgi:diadenylate cyclase
MKELWLAISNFFTSTINQLDLLNYIDIAIVSVIIYQVLKLTRRTRANQVIKGLILVLVALWLANLFKLQAIRWLLGYVVGAGAVVLVILFQPELRSALEHMGRGANIESIRHLSENYDGKEITEEIIRALSNLSRRKVGALIVIEQKTGLRDVAATGTTIDSVISSALLENIFEPNTPLHDGAVLISFGRIAAAGCYLNLTEDSGLSRELGTRHRAAIGVTEGRDCLSLIVSEETGIISYAQNGRLTRYLDADRLKELLTPIFAPKPKESLLAQLLKKEGNSNEK